MYILDQNQTHIYCFNIGSLKVTGKTVTFKWSNQEGLAKDAILGNYDSEEMAKKELGNIYAAINTGHSSYQMTEKDK